MPLTKRILGKTGRNVTIFGLGGEGILRSTSYHKEAQAVIEKALEVGITYFDTAPAYQQSRDYLGSYLWKKAKREQIFLASKTHDRTYEGTMLLLNDSLRRLKTSYLDLLQLHDLRTTQDIEEIFSDEGAIHALKEARKQGKVKFLGITGHHDPEILISAIKKYDFDTVLLCANAGDAHYLPFISTVIPEARKKGMGIIAMKVAGQGHALSSVAIKEALYYTLSQDVDLAIIGCRSPKEIEENAELVEEFRPLSREKLAEIENKTKADFENTNFFKKGMY
ncbi:aldo/keto reductase [Candidatus Woesearchaeota archaeon]|nr:aldo/keto reductase [Candidatus Woesearchaeota archaeon]